MNFVAKRRRHAWPICAPVCLLHSGDLFGSRKRSFRGPKPHPSFTVACEPGDSDPEGRLRMREELWRRGGESRAGGRGKA